MKHSSLCALFVVGCAAAHADAVLEYSGADSACHADFARLAVQGLSLRVDSAPPQQDMSFVYDAAEKVGVALDHGRKRFFEVEFDDDAIEFQGDVMKSTSTMVDKKVQQMESQMPRSAAASPNREAGMAGMPQIDPKLMESMMQQNMEHMTKEQRAQMEQAMRSMRESGYTGLGATQPEPVVEATGERRDVGGIACTVERVTQGGQLVREDCRAAIGAIGLDAADLKRLQRALLRMEKFAASIRENMRFVRAAKSETVDTQHLLVARRCFDRGSPRGDVTLQLRHDAAPAAWFSTPAGYARMDMGGNAGAN